MGSEKVTNLVMNSIHIIENKNNQGRICNIGIAGLKGRIHGPHGRIFNK